MWVRERARKGEGKTRSNITCGWGSPTKMSDMTKHEILNPDWLMVKWENLPSIAATIFFREVKKRNFREKTVEGIVFNFFSFFQTSNQT